MQRLVKKSRIRLNVFCFLALVLPMLATLSQAACSRDDIDYYLGKGFDTNQITAICGQSSTAATETGVSRIAESQGSFLIDVINGYDTVLTDDQLSYTIRKCYDIGEEDLFGFAEEICPEVRYSLTLDGMKIVDTARKYYIFGPPEIVLKGEVHREILTQLTEIKPKLKRLLRREIDAGDEVVLPIQQGAPMDRVQAELKKILR